MVSPLIDKGYFRLGFNGGCFLMLVSILSTSWCHKFWELLFVQVILTGIGMGMAFGSGILVLQSYFTSHLGIAAGLTSAGGSVADEEGSRLQLSTGGVGVVIRSSTPLSSRPKKILVHL
ncbi:hypothetical protein HO173_006241 [Letharia columbiana]|uniref:Uncharacterized protein n=1 Tax=Letharia columbiana TaxID=112416 RepID=A0A8H6FVK1_9LECA|nr:uncharacterized protein HO173_006241 [Letharia columbiana]KAF6235558.1 hypothetical protein HO173_006241 [Letharia columbiana]